MNPEERTILIVSADYARIRGMLREAGYTTAGVPDAESAREIFNSLQPALVIIDQTLLGRAGRSLPYFVHVLSKHPKTSLMLLHGPDTPPVASSPAEAFDAHCHVDAHGDELVECVKQLIGPPPQHESPDPEQGPGPGTPLAP